MKKLTMIICTSILLGSLFWLGGLVFDRQQLDNNLIRLHVVANSNSEADQAVKLQVRDAIMSSLQPDMQKISGITEAKEYLCGKLQQLEETANSALAACGSSLQAVVTLKKEAFPTREYETFSLPAGVYESLRVTIGEGEGKNWWCGVFPSLCLPAAGEDMTDAAVGAGFSDPLTDTLQQKEGFN
jgi:stage II sporulation protein R